MDYFIQNTQYSFLGVTAWILVYLQEQVGMEVIVYLQNNNFNAWFDSDVLIWPISTSRKA